MHSRNRKCQPGVHCCCVCGYEQRCSISETSSRRKPQYNYVSITLPRSPTDDEKMIIYTWLLCLAFQSELSSKIELPRRKRTVMIRSWFLLSGLSIHLHHKESPLHNYKYIYIYFPHKPRIAFMNVIRRFCEVHVHPWLFWNRHIQKHVIHHFPRWCVSFVI